MPRLKPLAALLSVILVAACGQDRAETVPTDARESASDSAHEVHEALVAHALGHADALPAELEPGDSAMQAAVVALHDLLLERVDPAPTRAALFDAMDVLAARPGGCDAEPLAKAVPIWRTWTDAECAAEARWALSLTLATAALSLPEAPGPDGLGDLVRKAEQGGPAPARSPAAAGMTFVRYAEIALREPGSDVSDAQHAALGAARDAFDALGWPSGLAALAEPVALHLLARDPAGVRGTVLWTTATESYRAAGNLVASGRMYLDRARDTWWGQADAEAVDRARKFAEAGLARLQEGGARPGIVAEARAALAAAQQASGQHAAAVETAARVIATEGELPTGVRARMEQLRAVSLLRLGRFDECVAAADEASRLHADVAVAPDDARQDALQQMACEVDEVAGAALLELGRAPEAARRYSRAAERHDERARNAAAADRSGPENARDAARLLAARCLARSGDPDGAREAVGRVLSARSQPAGLLALAADVLLDAGLIDDAADVLAQTRAKLGDARSGALGEIAGRIAVARGDIASARLGFQAALDAVTGRDGERHGPPAARILRHWAEAERDLGDRAVAASLVRQALGHLDGSGMTAEISALSALLRDLER